MVISSSSKLDDHSIPSQCDVPGFWRAFEIPLILLPTSRRVSEDHPEHDHDRRVIDLCDGECCRNGPVILGEDDFVHVGRAEVSNRYRTERDVGDEDRVRCSAHILCSFNRHCNQRFDFRRDKLLLAVVVEYRTC